MTLARSAALAVIVLASCAPDRDPAPSPGPPASIEVVQGDGQSGEAGAALAEPISVRVLDARGNGVPGVTVTFTPATGSGSVPSETVRSDQQGAAQTTWTLGPATGTQTLAIGADSAAPAAVTATALLPPAIVSVIATDLDVGTTVVTAPGQDGGWSIGPVDPSRRVVFVKVNQLLDGLSVQTTPESMTPADGWAATRSGQPLTSFLLAYFPATDETGDVSSVVFAPEEAPSASGWMDAPPLVAGATYQLSGTVRTKTGLELPIAVTVTVAPAQP